MMDLPKHIRTLEKAGFTKDQAETHVLISVNLMEDHVKDLATKESLNLLRSDMNTRFDRVDVKFAQIEGALKLINEQLRLDREKSEKQLKLDREQFELMKAKFDFSDKKIKDFKRDAVISITVSLGAFISIAAAVVSICVYLF